MGRRRHDGRRRAAKVEARRRRRAGSGVTRPPRGARPLGAAVERVTAPLLSDCELLEQFPHAFDDDEDELDDGWDDEDDAWDDGGDDRPDRLDLLDDGVRAALRATVVQQDPEVARALVARGEQFYVNLFVGSWLAKARRRFPQADLAERATAWVAEVLGEAGPAVDDAARVLGPAAREALRGTLFRIPDDVLVARIWLLAAVLVVGGAGGDRWLEGLDATAER
ncbi:hypothetical protein ACQPX6_18125 [Actinomycetospora sp. CA-101289]|uniref:hypothetical protein n=1 Tax=Actinomycetospora sp. CA-101289 TaxID=3239893 RepID=UPI003D95DB46